MIENHKRERKNDMMFDILREPDDIRHFNKTPNKNIENATAIW